MNKITFDANYGRHGSIDISKTKCDGCGNEKICLKVDQSEGEYTPGNICKECIDRMFSEYER